MAFPQTPLPIKVEISLDNSTWTNITSDVRSDDQVRITRGRSEWGQQVDAGRCSFSLENTTGKYSPRNPEGTYYGQIGRNTPVRVSVETGSVALDLPGESGDYISTPDAAALDITGDIDIRFDATLNNWILPDYPSSGQTDFHRTELIGKSASGQVSWILYVRLSKLYLVWSTNGSTLSAAASTVDLPLTTSGRLAVRATLDVDNGASGHDVKFYTSDSISGTWTQLGSTVTGSGTTSIFSGTAALRIGSVPDVSYDEAIGLVHGAEVRSGIGGSAVANPDFTAQSSGTTSFADSAGRTWTVAGNASITNRKVRFVGEVASWTPRWDTGGFDVVTEVEAVGVMRRLGQGAVPVKSPMRRELTSTGRSSLVAAYWPMEDGESATSFGSAIDGHPSFKITGSVTPAAYSDWVGSDAVPTVGTGSMKVTVPSFTLDGTNPAVQLGFFCKVPAAGVTSTQRLFSMGMTGLTATWSVYVNTSGNLDVRAYDQDGTQTHASGFGSDSVNGLEKYVIMQLTTPIATSITYILTVMDVSASMTTAVPDDNPSTFQITDTINATTRGTLSAIRFGEDGAMNSTAIGQVYVGNATTSSNGLAAPVVGWNAEEAPSRAARLGEEEDIHSYPTGPGDEQMGVQARSTVLELMQAAESVDSGILAEQRNILGIRYVTRASLYSQPVAFTMDYEGTNGLVAPLDPVDDDQSVTNDVTVARDGGASARTTLSTGALSTLAPPNGIGVYDTSYTLNLLSDSQPPLHAGWQLHIGTWDETRFPQVTVNLANATSSIENATKVDTGSRIQITNPPVWLPPDTLDMMVQGYSEVMDQYTWSITYNCTPHGPWNVAWAGDTGDNTAVVANEFSWADTEGAQLSEALTTTETDVDVTTTSGPVWTSDPEDSPYDLRVGGEVMTVTAPHSLLNDNPFFGTDTTGWSANASTIVRSTAFVCPHPRAVASLKITPDGVAASGGADASTRTAVGSITPNAEYVASMWVYSPGGWSDLRPVIDWYDSANVFISSSLGAASSVTAGVWTYIEQTLTAASTASRAAMRARHGGTPAASDVYYVWAVRLTRLKASFLFDNFGRTATDTWSTADSSQTWQTGGGVAGNYDVTGGYGSHTLTTVNASRRSFVDFTYADFDYYVDVTTSATATGGSLFGGPTARYTDADNLYMARLEFTTANALILSIRERVAAAEAELGTFTLRTTHVAGTFIRVRFQGFGTALKAKAWLTTEPEPGAWQIEVTDSSLTTSSFAGVRSIASSANTNVNPEVRYDNLDLFNPQTFVVTRSQNGVVKTHSAAASVVLASPAYTAL